MSKFGRTLCSIALGTLTAFTAGNVLAKGGLIDLYPATFGSDSDVIDNPWWELAQGTRMIYFEEEECVLGVVDVMYDGSQFRDTVNSVDVREVLDREFIDDDEECDGDVLNPEDPEWTLVEKTLDWYAQDEEGVIWYFGEHSIALPPEASEDECDHWTGPVAPFFLTGCLDGSWESGYDIWEDMEDEDIKEGIIMLNDDYLQKGVFYFQEFWEDEATDMAKILNFKPLDTFLWDDLDGCAMIKEWAPLDPGNVEHKYYCRDYGLPLIEVNAGGPTVYEELVYQAVLPPPP